MTDHTVLDSLIRRAKALQGRPEHAFRDFESLCRGLSRADTSSLIAFMAERGATVAKGDGLTEAYVYLWRDGALNIQVKVIGPEATTGDLSANELDLVMMNISPHDVEIPAYRTDIDSSDLARRPGPIVRLDALRLASHAPVYIPAYRDILDLKATSEHATVLIFHSTARGPLTWVFDRATGLTKHLTSTNLQDSRIQLAALLLGAMGSKPDADVLRALALSNNAAFVRWEAAEALYRLDPEAGVALLRDRLSHDSDRAVARAATATLSMLR